MTRANSLRVREAGSLISLPVTHERTTTHTSIPARASPSRRPSWAATAELLVPDLIAQHDPEPNPELARRRDARFAEPLLLQFAPVEALELGIAPHRMDRRFAPEKPQQRVALFAQRPDSGGDARLLRSSRVLRLTEADFVVRSGRALVYPVYKGTYERIVERPSPNILRDNAIARGKDLRRVIDYIEARPISIESVSATTG